MPFPSGYERKFGFEGFQDTHPSTPLPGTQVDVELDSVAKSTAALTAFLQKFTRADGKLANGSVGVDQLAADFSISFKAPTTWEPGIMYVLGDTVFQGSGFYTCVAAHTSGGVFEPADWDLIVDFGSSAQAAAASAAAAEASAVASAAGVPTASTFAALRVKYGSGVALADKTIVNLQSGYVDGGAAKGRFIYDANDNSTVDDGGLCVIDAQGRRFKRLYDGLPSLEFWEAQSDGSTDCSGRWASAVSACDARGLPLRIPPLLTGSFLIQTTDVATPVSFPKAGLRGAGRNSVIKLNSVGVVDQATDFVVSDVSFVFGSSSTHYGLLEVMRSNATVNRVWTTSDGVLASGSSTAFTSAFQLRFQGCPDVKIDESRFYNFNDAVYFEKYSSTPCGRCVVTNSHFELEAFGNLYSYPVGVYGFFADDVSVDNCTFKNIFPGNLTNPAPIGYAVYDGDGAVGKLTVTNCRYVTDKPRVDTALVIASTASEFIAANNMVEATDTAGGIVLAKSNGNALASVTNNQGIRADIFVAEAGTSGDINITGNQLRYGAGGAAMIRCGANASVVGSVTIRDNSVYYGTNGGIFVNVANWFCIDDNEAVGCNTLNTSWDPGNNEFLVSGICVFGPVLGVVSRNRVYNEYAGAGAYVGHMKYGFASSSASHDIQIEPNNRFQAIETGPVLNGHTSSNRPGTFGAWQAGNVCWYQGSAATAAPGEYCISSASTRVTVAGNSGDTTLVVTSSTGFVVGAKVAVGLNTGAVHSTTIFSIADGTHIELTVALPANISAGNEVRSNLFKLMAATT